MVFQIGDTVGLVIWVLAVVFVAWYLFGKYIPRTRFKILNRIRAYRMKFKNKVGGLIALGLIGGSVLIGVSGLNPWLDEGLWNKLPANMIFWKDWIEDNPDAGVGHLEFNQEDEWSRIDVTFSVRLGYDDVDNSLIAGTPTFTILRGSEGNWVHGYTGSLASGIGTTTNFDGYSGEIVTLIIGDLGDPEDGDNPTKPMVYRAVIQGKNGADKPTNVRLGEGTFLYYGTPDDDDIAVTWHNDDGAVFGSNEIDYADDFTNGKLTVGFRTTFTDEGFGLMPYYDWMNNRWYDWFITFKLTYNTTADEATDCHAITITCNKYGIVSADIGSQDKGWAVAVTNGMTKTDNSKPNVIAYDTDAGGTIFAGKDVFTDVFLVFDLSGCGIITDDGLLKYTLTGELGTHFSQSVTSQTGAIANLGDTIDNYWETGATSTTIIG
jgi:hypothetical protein